MGDRVNNSNKWDGYSSNTECTEMLWEQLELGEDYHGKNHYKSLLEHWRLTSGTDYLQIKRLKPLKSMKEFLIKEWSPKIDPTLEYVYIFYDYDDQRYKIGYSKSPVERCYQVMLKLNHVIGIEHLIPTTQPRELEATLHEVYHEKRQDGEWFDLSEDDLQDIKDMK
jgi:hypothetical protein